MPDAEVVIVGQDGTEHVFPPGFDPKQAASIVRTRTTTPKSTSTIGGVEDGTKGVTFGDQAREMGWIEDLGMAGAAHHPPEGAGSDRTRPDNSILGVPPELAVVSALGVGRAAAGGGPTLGGKAMAGAKAAVDQVAPIAKYEMARTALTALGVPSEVATALAIAFGFRKAKGAKGAPRTPRAPRQPKATPAAGAPARPPASAPAAATPPAPSSAPSVHPASMPAPTPPAPSLPVKVLKGETLDLPAAMRTPGQMSPASIRMDLGLVARRAKVVLEKAELDEAARLVTAGRSPIEAVAEIAHRGGKLPGSLPTPPAGMPAAPATAARLKLSSDEGKVYVLLLRKGKSHQEAIEAIQAQRALGAMPGVTTPSAADRAVRERLTTGRWPAGRPGTQ